MLPPVTVLVVPVPLFFNVEHTVPKDSVAGDEFAVF